VLTSPAISQELIRLRQQDFLRVAAVHRLAAHVKVPAGRRPRLTRMPRAARRWLGIKSADVEVAV